MSTCIHCHQKGHRIMQCSQFHADLMKPAPGVCGRCGGAGTFMPYVARAAQAKQPASVEARFFCPCCSVSTCSHKAVSAA